MKVIHMLWLALYINVILTTNIWHRDFNQTICIICYNLRQYFIYINPYQTNCIQDNDTCILELNSGTDTVQDCIPNYFIEKKQ